MWRLRMTKKLENIPLNLEECICKIKSFASMSNMKVLFEEKRGHLAVRILNENKPALLRIYTTKKGITIDGSSGSNIELNKEALLFIRDIVPEKRTKEERITIKNVKESEFDRIINKIGRYVDSNEFIEMTVETNQGTSIINELTISHTQTKEKLYMKYYCNGTLYLNGFNIHLIDEITNIISTVLECSILLKHDVLDEIVRTCHERFLVEGNKECASCNSNCNGDCNRLLHSIHYGSKERYSCNRAMNYYMSKFAYRYASEADKILGQYKEVIDGFKEMHIMSIGCGPATELLGSINYAMKEKKRLYYNGIDINDKWVGIHDYFKSLPYSGMDVRFYYRDIFKFIEKINPDKGNLNSNIVFFQYVISDMAKYYSDHEMKTFFDRFKVIIIDCLPVDSLLIFNDVNNERKARRYFEMAASLLEDSKYEVKRFHFNPAYKEYSEYGFEIENHNINYKIPKTIEEHYNSWATCKSAALVIRKVN